MNEILLWSLFVAIPGATWLLLRRAGMTGTPKGKFWFKTSGCLVLILMILTMPASGASVRADIFFVLFAAALVSDQFVTRRKSGAPLAPAWVALALGLLLTTVVLLIPGNTGTVSPALSMAVLVFFAIWQHYRTAYAIAA